MCALVVGFFQKKSSDSGSVADRPLPTDVKQESFWSLVCWVNQAKTSSSSEELMAVCLNTI